MKRILISIVLSVASIAVAMECEVRNKLVEATRSNDYDEVVKLVKEGADVNAVMTHLPDGYDLEIKGVTPLICAANYGYTKIAEFLIENSADINPPKRVSRFQAGKCRNLFGSSPLHFACENGHSEMVELLIAHKADINAGNDVGHTPLHNAVANGHLEVVKLLLDAGAYTDPETVSMVTLSVVSQEMLKFSSTSYAYGSPLCSAINVGRIGIAEYLIDHGANVHVMAAGGGVLYGETLKKPRQYSQYVFNYPEVPTKHPLLLLAMFYGYSSLISKLKEAGASLQGIDSSLLLGLCSIGEFEDELDLITACRGASQHTSCGGTISICEAGEFNVCKDGTSLREKRVRLITSLLQSGVINLEALDTDFKEFSKNYDVTALIWAAFNGHKDVCKLLLEAGANNMVQNKYGRTALDCARIERNKLIVSLVKKWQTEATLKDAEDCKKFTMLCEKKNRYDDIIDLLHQKNVLPLKCQCINKVRDLLKDGTFNKEDMPHLDEFGFTWVVIPEKKESLEDNNNNKMKE